MDKEQVVQILHTHRESLREHGIHSIALFGSIARGEADATSDVDLVVEFSLPRGLFELVGLQSYLEKLLGCPVDLLTRDGIKARMRESILSECVDVSSALD